MVIPVCTCCHCNQEYTSLVEGILVWYKVYVLTCTIYSFHYNDTDSVQLTSTYTAKHSRSPGNWHAHLIFEQDLLVET